MREPDCTLRDFIIALLLSAHEHSLPLPMDEDTWQRAFYELKYKSPTRPVVVRNLVFERQSQPPYHQISADLRAELERLKSDNFIIILTPLQANGLNPLLFEFSQQKLAGIMPRIRVATEEAVALFRMMRF